MMQPATIHIWNFTLGSSYPSYLSQSRAKHSELYTLALTTMKMKQIHWGSASWKSVADTITQIKGYQGGVFINVVVVYLQQHYYLFSQQI